MHTYSELSKSVLTGKFERLEDNKDRLYLMSAYNYDSENNSMGLCKLLHPTPDRM